MSLTAHGGSAKSCWELMARPAFLRACSSCDGKHGSSDCSVGLRRYPKLGGTWFNAGAIRTHTRVIGTHSHGSPLYHKRTSAPEEKDASLYGRGLRWLYAISRPRVSRSSPRHIGQRSWATFLRWRLTWDIWWVPWASHQLQATAPLCGANAG
jgi:hypothetical protein